MGMDRIAPEEAERVAVLGAGTIGATWAALFLARGLAVDVYDVSPDAKRYVRSYVETAWPALERLNMVDGADPSRIRFFADAAEAVRDAQFVQESVPERLDIKHQTYRTIEPAMAPETIVGGRASVHRGSPLKSPSFSPTVFAQRSQDEASRKSPPSVTRSWSRCSNPWPRRRRDWTTLASDLSKYQLWCSFEIFACNGTART